MLAQMWRRRVVRRPLPWKRQAMGSLHFTPTAAPLPLPSRKLLRLTAKVLFPACPGSKGTCKEVACCFMECHSRLQWTTACIRALYEKPLPPVSPSHSCNDANTCDDASRVHWCRHWCRCKGERWRSAIGVHPRRGGGTCLAHEGKSTSCPPPPLLAIILRQ